MNTDMIQPDCYGEILDHLKAQVRAAQLRAHRIVNTELLGLYWTIGRTILERQAAEGWGARVINRLANDLRAEFPDVRGFSGRNLQYMASAARAWPAPIAQQAAAQLPWGHIMVLLDRLDDQAERDWYVAAATEHGWSRSVLLNQIKNQLRLRTGAAPSSFPASLPPADSDLAQQLTRDPYVFDFLDITATTNERALGQGLIDSLQATLSEFGRGFSFVGRQVHFDVDGKDFYIDLLFFHNDQLRHVVVELKIGPFEPQFTGQLAFYVSLVDDKLRKLDRHAPTVGILLCAERNDRVVRYALAGGRASHRCRGLHVRRPGPNPGRGVAHSHRTRRCRRHRHYATGDDD
ncbi:PDDEXK nuclease domain-containing protein [Kribbella deserti]|uniref:YhcG family protein n=1 Tax=Kribbella deserti TaxID=1926257 RepID=A0ABV6QU00_9ACTN